jgi:hypothetical protein
MCELLSAVIDETGQIHVNPETMHHSEIWEPKKYRFAPADDAARAIMQYFDPETFLQAEVPMVENRQMKFWDFELSTAYWHPDAPKTIRTRGGIRAPRGYAFAGNPQPGEEREIPLWLDTNRVVDVLGVEDAFNIPPHVQQRGDALAAKFQQPDEVVEIGRGTPHAHSIPAGLRVGVASKPLSIQPEGMSMKGMLEIVIVRSGGHKLDKPCDVLVTFGDATVEVPSARVIRCYDNSCVLTQDLVPNDIEEAVLRNPVGGHHDITPRMSGDRICGRVSNLARSAYHRKSALIEAAEARG